MYFESEQDSEDFQGWVILKRLEGRRAKTIHLYYDYLRQNIGDQRKKHFDAQRAVNKPTYFREYASGQVELPAACNIENATTMSEYNESLTRIVGRLNKDERIIFNLRVVWGLTYAEIANCFGLSEGRICQRFKRIQKGIQEKEKSLLQQYGILPGKKHKIPKKEPRRNCKERSKKKNHRGIYCMVHGIYAQTRGKGEKKGNFRSLLRKNIIIKRFTGKKKRVCKALLY